MRTREEIKESSGSSDLFLMQNTLEVLLDIREILQERTRY